MNQKEITKLIDEAVKLDTQIKELEKQLKEKKEQLVSLGEGAHTGKLGSVSIAMQTRNVFKADKAKQYMTEEQFSRCYEESKTVICRFTKFVRD